MPIGTGQHHQLVPTLPGIAARRSFAPSPVWRHSVAKAVRFQPMTRKEAARLWHEARRFEQATRQPGRQDGALGRNGLAVLYVLLFDFLNYVTGRLDPAVDTIAAKANISPRSAARGLVALKAAGVVSWVRRCVTEIGSAGRAVFRQLSNAYGMLPISCWRRHQAPAEPPAPETGTWGDHPPMPSAIAQAASATTLAEKLEALESEPRDSLAAALARLGRAVDNCARPSVLPGCQTGNETIPKLSILGQPLNNSSHRSRDRAESS
ncbi:MAG: hypothetical protein WCC64_20100 [Aliidongia sp.]